MRISDLSSDVCSSDLPPVAATPSHSPTSTAHSSCSKYEEKPTPSKPSSAPSPPYRQTSPSSTEHSRATHTKTSSYSPAFPKASRSDARRVGKEWFSTCRSRCSPYQYKKTTQNI